MILAVDIGNTTMTFGIFDGGELLIRFALSSSERTTPEKCWNKLQSFITPEMKIDGAVFSSVVPSASEVFKEFATRFLDVHVKEFTLVPEMGITNKYSMPSQVGADRLVNAFAVKQFYSLPAIVVDTGTAITIDTINADGEYLGGVILPGLTMSADALHKKTSLLPKVEILIPNRVLGTNTETSIQSGLTYGFAHMIHSLVNELKRESGIAGGITVATGGHSRILEPLISGFTDDIDDSLTLRGLNSAYSFF